ncbi:AraC family transcriptional regulator [Aquirhabdus parva]|uniref:Helix-turn-helix domain-containing protein n=1 Tax=Aquirhabdus parva TaxID=2283318 RepID=A0A345P6C2_9GAMM|nr:AraC family transcriptional regulator [Aquirhabdus parva]AXI02831.1 helix-turn-helix domain-containing protein [Aquirhabdus parva]
MTPPPEENYLSRFQKVLDYIDTHLDNDLTVDLLSQVASFSKFHFHRQFSELFGINVYKYIQLTRLKRASYQLAFRTQNPVTHIALESGYEGPESFSRAFKKILGQSPTEFRKQPHWHDWHATFKSLDDIRITRMTTLESVKQVQIINFPETQIAALEHRGDPQLLGQSIRRFIEWRKQHQLTPSLSKTFNILYEDPENIDPEQYRIDIGVETNMLIKDDSIGMVSKTIPSGRCAVLRHIGSDDLLRKAIHNLYAIWLPSSGEELRDFPVFLQRIKFFPDVPKSEAVIDIFLPLK